MFKKQLSSLKLADIITILGLQSTLIAIFGSIHHWGIIIHFALYFQYLMDFFDGKIARKYGASKLGIYLDSFADFSSILALSIILWQFNPHLGGMIGGSAFIIAASIRLAFFTDREQSGQKGFIGLPTTAAGFLINTLWLILPASSFGYFSIIYLIFSLLMICDLKLPKL